MLATFVIRAGMAKTVLCGFGLTKIGAAGQAVQNMNLALGYAETAGLL